MTTRNEWEPSGVPTEDVGAQVNARLDELAREVHASRRQTSRVRVTPFVERDQLPGYQLDKHSPDL